MNEWQDISTAPKDEQLLGFWQYWYPGDASPTTGYGLIEVTERGVSDHEGVHTIYTHWMRLPKEPEATP